MSFVHLHVHSEYSLLDGFSNIKKLIKRAKEMNMPAVALTDHGTMFGVIDFYNAATAAGIKPIIGVESYLAARNMSSRDPQFDKKSSHLLLLAENDTGYRNLLQIASAAQLGGFYYYPRIDHEFLAKHSEGIICTSGCMSAEVPRLLQNGDFEGARKQLDWYYEVFGPERFYLELQEHDIPELANINKMLVDLGRRYQAKFVATNDVHYINREDARLQDILLAIQTGCVLSDPNRMRMTDNSYYLRSAEEMARLFAEVPEALENTLLIAERCNIDLSFKGYHLPHFPVPEGKTAESYLRELCEAGLQKRYGPRASDPAVRQRLDYELGIIHKMGFDTYFLIVWDLCSFARQEGIWYNARGSAAGSMTAYTLDITRVDPIEHGLIFERFLNPGRISMPDIDLDFRDDRRVEMLKYTAQKYGDDKVAQIITFGTLGARAAIRDVGRVMDIPLSEVDRVAKLIPNIPGKPVTVEQALEEITDFKDLYKSEPYLKELIDTAMDMEGVVRNAGTHAAGVIITDKPTIEYIPLHRPTGNAGNTGSALEEIPIKTVTQFEMSVVESLGLLKVDFLGLDTLSIMARACDLIRQRRGIDLNLDNIPIDDPATYELLGRGDTAGVFQVEGCLSGDTYIGHRKIKDLYKDFTERQAKGIHSKRRLLKTLSCYLDEGRFNYNEIVHVVSSGVKPVYRLVADNNLWVKATADHHFLTQRGWVRLGDLDPEEDKILFKSNASRLGRLCVDCGQPMKSESRRAQRCKRCSAHFTSNPSRPEVRQRIANTKLGSIPWNRGLTAETAADTLWIKNLSVYNNTQKGLSLEERLGEEKASRVKARLSELFSGTGNPMYGRTPTETKTYTKSGYREDLGHYVRSTWEADLARIFKYLGYEYQYEPRTFELNTPEGKTQTYTPDFYVPSIDSWFEVKGWMDQASAKKISLFQEQYPECKLVIVDKTRFAEFQLQYKDLVAWECPSLPFDSEWVSIRSIDPVGEEETYDLHMLAPGNNFVANGFIVHNSGMRRWLMQMKPKELANVIAMVALFRPGPMDFIPGYIRRMHGEEEVEYRHPALEPIFKETYGYPVYQEQLMFAVMNLAGYTAPEADDLRKAISKKQKEKLLKHREKFIQGAQQREVPAETAAVIFDDWEEFARYGFNKCLPGDVEVLDAATGRLVKLEDLYYGRSTLQETLTCDLPSLQLQAGRVAAIMFNGVKPVFRLTTALGRRIEATGNHPFYTDEGWRKLEELQIGDYLAVPRRLPVEGTAEWPEHEVKVLGHLLAEGNLCHPNSVYFYSQDPDQLEDFVEAAGNFQNVRCTVSQHKGIYYAYARRNELKIPPGIVLWAQRLGIWGKNAREKEIPAEVFLLTNRQIALLISRMWEGDGHINTRGNSLFYATASERMARQLQHLLLRMGIISRLREVNFPYKDGRVGYQLFITRGENITAFAEQIGVHFLSEQRRNALHFLCRIASGRSSKDIVPTVGVKALVRAARDRQGITWKQLNAESGIAEREFYPTNSAGKLGFTRPTLARLADYFDDAQIRRLAESDIYWDRIIAIEPVGAKPTYDLEVPGIHNFVANDILVHNSHAADYGILSVQTAYLKTHYPVEYMTAVLSVRKNDSAKVALYVVDCRRMGIAVEPPEINTSNWDFTIEDCPDGTSSIRFGLGAVKNVGQGPVDVFLKARQDGPFTDLNDLARRADLRQVGKRALESLIKVGALDSLGPRIALLESIDRIVSVSASHFRAAEMGQMSLFGAHTGITEEIVLPKTNAEIGRREILNWERELIGLYVSDHPLSPVMDDLTEAVTHFSGQLSEANPNDRVRVAGIVTRLRHHQSKAGKPMGFVTMEDLQGNIELVVFPRVWEKFSPVIDVDKIILVDGRIDNSGAEPKILVDNISTDFTRVVSSDTAVTAKPAQAMSYTEPNPGIRENRASGAPAHQLKDSPVDGIDEPAPEDLFWNDEIPEPPVEISYESSSLSLGAIAATIFMEGREAGENRVVEQPPAAAGEKIENQGTDVEGDTNASVQNRAMVYTSPQKAQVSPVSTADQSDSQLLPNMPVSVPHPQFLISPVAQGDGELIQMITVVLRSTEDKTRDVLRIRRLHGTLMSYPGKDRFAFQVFERGRGYLVEFPNFTTGVCSELISRLTLLVGSENVRVEPITFQ